GTSGTCLLQIYARMDPTTVAWGKEHEAVMNYPRKNVL
ncbi:hypothetical protein NPIL_11002, partial [Nephila pilipes]